MPTRFSITTLAIALVSAVACSDDTKEESPGEVLARDSTLASDLRQADTSAFADPADVMTASARDSDRVRPRTVRGPVLTVRRPMRPAPATIHADPVPTHTMPPASSGEDKKKARAAQILKAVPGSSLPPERSER